MAAPHALITCSQLIEFLDDYLAGTLPPDVRRDFEHHLSICRQCVDYLQMYQDTVRLGKAAFANDADGPPPASVPEDLVRAVIAATATKR